MWQTLTTPGTALDRGRCSARTLVRKSEGEPPGTHHGARLLGGSNCGGFEAWNRPLCVLGFFFPGRIFLRVQERKVRKGPN